MSAHTTPSAANTASFNRVARASLDRRPLTLRNDTTDGSALRFHGHRIASYYGDEGTIIVSLAGHATQSTIRRLHALAQLVGDTHKHFTVREGEPELNGRPIGPNDWFTLIPATR